MMYAFPNRPKREINQHWLAIASTFVMIHFGAIPVCFADVSGAPQPLGGQTATIQPLPGGPSIPGSGIVHGFQKTEVKTAPAACQMSWKHVENSKRTR